MKKPIAHLAAFVFVATLVSASDVKGTPSFQESGKLRSASAQPQRTQPPKAQTRREKLSIVSKLLVKQFKGISSSLTLDIRHPYEADKASFWLSGFGLVYPEYNSANRGTGGESCHIGLQLKVVRPGKPHLISFHIRNEYNWTDFEAKFRSPAGGDSSFQTFSVPPGPYIVSYVVTPPQMGLYTVYFQPSTTLSFYFYKVEISVMD